MKPQQSTNVDMIAANIYLIPLIMLIMPMKDMHWAVWKICSIPIKQSLINLADLMHDFSSKQLLRFDFAR